MKLSDLSYIVALRHIVFSANNINCIESTLCDSGRVVLGVHLHQQVIFD